MTTPHTPCLARALLRAFALFFLCSAAAIFTAAAADGRVAFDVPAGEAGQTLKRFAQQAKREILFPVQPVGNVTTNPVRGEFSVREALDRLLAGTELSAFEDVKTGAIVVKREPAPNAPSRRAIDAAAAEDKSATAVRVENGAVKLDDYAVTGSRIRRDPTELGASPVQVFDRQAIERSGAISMSDFTRRLTQNTNDLTGLTAGNGPLGARTLVSLRGLSQGTTLVLINGRRMNRSGQAFSFATADYNLSGIPLASIERVEVLTDGASAIYGADAVGGVINIIMRRDYRGAELVLQYGNSTHSDAAERAATLSAGFASERAGGSVSVNYSTRNSYGADARPYTATSNPSGGRDGRTPGGGAGVIVEFDGILTNGFAGIPAGQNGIGLTLADFEALDGAASLWDPATFSNTLDATESRSARGEIHFDVRRWLVAYVEASHNATRTINIGAPPRGENFVVPSYNPLNPLEVDLDVTKTFYELGRSRFHYDTASEDAVVGLRGEIGASWRYDLSGGNSKLVDEGESIVPDTIDPDRLFDLMNTTDAATSLNVFGDGRIPLPAAHLTRLRSALGEFKYRTEVEARTLELRADGELWSGPTGTVRLAFGGELRRDEISHASKNTTGRAFAQISRGVERRGLAQFAELQAPLIKAAPGRTLLNALDLQFAIRRDDIDGFTPEVSPKYGLLWRPHKSVRLRASLSDGFRVPNLYFLVLPTTTRNTQYRVTNNVFDRVRNEIVTGTVSVMTGGNPNLLPEKSESRNFGIIFEPSFLSGLSLSADYYDITHSDRVTSALNEQDILDYFPSRFTRAATVNGVPGRVISFDRRATNVEFSRVRGIDYHLKYRRVTSLGQITFDASATRAMHHQQRLTPGAILTDRIDTFSQPKWRATASVAWDSGPFGIGAYWRYAAGVRNFFPSPARVHAASEFDVNASFDFQKRSMPPTGRITRWLKDVRVNFGILNVLNTTPPSTNGEGGFIYLDPRQQRYWASVVKRF